MFQKPSIAELREAAHGLGMHPSEDYLLAVDEIVAPLAKAYAALVPLHSDYDSLNVSG